MNPYFTSIISPAGYRAYFPDGLVMVPEFTVRKGQLAGLKKTLLAGSHTHHVRHSGFGLLV